METTATAGDPATRARRYWALAAAAALLPFVQGAETAPLAAWLAPLFLLRFTRAIRGPSGWILAWLALLAGWLVQLRGMVPLPFWGMIALGSASALLGLLPYAVDRSTARRAAGFASTLVFPSAVAGLEFALGSVSPYGSWCTLGYSQYGDLPLMQLASVTGIFGISFIVSWLAPVANWAWERDFDWKRIQRGALAFAAVLASVAGFGSARLLLSDRPVRAWRIAAITADDMPIFPSSAAQNRFWAGAPLTGDERAAVRSAAAARSRRLLAASEREAGAGARLVFWSEGAAWVLRSDEPALIAEGSELAARHRAYLGMAILSMEPGRPKPVQNKLVLVGPDGRVLFEYWKSRPVPGPEALTMETNGNPMGLADTPFGRIGAFICFDLDFPGLVRQAGRARVDTVIAPSNDWAAIDPFHTRMAVFRAIENGFNLVRDVGSGRSIAVDSLGRSLAETDYYSGARSIVAYVPFHGTQTAYSRLGDVFGWLCAFAAVGLPFVLRRRSGPGGGSSRATERVHP
jgi:apolipoprotein N-acyltransferase